MTTLIGPIERYHNYIMATLALVIVAMVVSCIFDGAIPICHYIFGCDHGFHAAIIP